MALSPQWQHRLCHRLALLSPRHHSSTFRQRSHLMAVTRHTITTAAALQRTALRRPRRWRTQLHSRHLGRRRSRTTLQHQCQQLAPSRMGHRQHKRRELAPSPRMLHQQHRRRERAPSPRMQLLQTRRMAVTNRQAILVMLQLHTKAMQVKAMLGKAMQVILRLEPLLTQVQPPTRRPPMQRPTIAAKVSSHRATREPTELQQCRPSRVLDCSQVVAAFLVSHSFSSSLRQVAEG